jgi:hypothetical protein
MTILQDVVAELIGMFVGDAGLSLAILAVVAVTAGLIEIAQIEPLVGGGVLLFGCLAVLIGAVHRGARRQSPPPDQATEVG